MSALEIITNMERYHALLKKVAEHCGEAGFYKKQINKFKAYIELSKHFMAKKRELSEKDVVN